MGTLTGFWQRRENRPAGLHHENHCVQKESISAFQCNSIHSQKARKQFSNGNATWLQVEGKEGGGLNLFIGSCCLLRYHSFSLVWLHTSLFELSAVRHQQPRPCGSVCVCFCTCRISLKGQFSCTPLVQGTSMKILNAGSHIFSYIFQHMSK